MPLAGRLLREPLVQFFIIGAAVFALHAVVGDQQGPTRDRIVVTEGRAQQLTHLFARTWQRPPTGAELRGLIESYIKEEVYYREALERGLDRDDTVIRRRMQQKMEFLTEPREDAFAATDAELEQFLEANRERFVVEPMAAFSQVFVKTDAGGEAAAERARRVLVSIRDREPGEAVLELADRTLLPPAVPLAPISVIARTFGPDFASAIVDLPIGTWAGPVASPFGLHLVWVVERRDGYEPRLAEVRDAVERQWRAQKRDEFREAEFRRLREGYEIVLPPGFTGSEDVPTSDK